ncbi:hypothetical protein EVAR_92436_1 [Eumeta japonica]|uniref:Odorant receptor n=1 Tax=Eumeta variegata TaxID=151549 RepID=A0A4C1T6R4_EUMVA|nr:hypothetical protein EVAR_92436_1 [Eumeta japonica]
MEQLTVVLETTVAVESEDNITQKERSRSQADRLKCSSSKTSIDCFICWREVKKHAAPPLPPLSSTLPNVKRGLQPPKVDHVVHSRAVDKLHATSMTNRHFPRKELEIPDIPLHVVRVYGLVHMERGVVHADHVQHAGEGHREQQRDTHTSAGAVQIQEYCKFRQCCKLHSNERKCLQCMLEQHSGFMFESLILEHTLAGNLVAQVVNEHIFDKLARAMKSEYLDVSNPRRQEIVKWWLKRSNKFLKILASLGTTTVLLWYIIPTMDGIKYNLTNNVRLPIDYRTPTRYPIAYLIVVFGFHCTSYFVILNDCLMQVHLIHTLCQFAVLSDCFEYMIVEAKEDAAHKGDDRRVLF